MKKMSALVACAATAGALAAPSGAMAESSFKEACEAAGLPSEELTLDLSPAAKVTIWTCAATPPPPPNCTDEWRTIDLSPLIRLRARTCWM